MSFVAVVLFAIIGWGADHSRTYWLPMLVALILLSILAAFYAARGTRRSLATLLHSRSARNAP